MSVEALKQYIEKELHTKRFLEDGMTMITQFEGLTDSLAEVKAKIDKEKEILGGLLQTKEEAKAQVDAILTDVKTNKQEATEIIDNAKIKARKIIQDAKEEAELIFANAKIEVEDLNIDVRKKQAELDSLVKEVDALLTKREEMNKELENIRKKFA